MEPSLNPDNSISGPNSHGPTERIWQAPPWTPLAFVAGVALLALLLSYVGFALARPTAPRSAASAASSAGAAHVHLALDIFPVRPLGPSSNWPAYTPSTHLTVPASSLVSVTIRNFDLGDAPLGPSSPFAHVEGTLGRAASMDGQPYSALDPAHVAHTFTIPQLHVSVPIPGESPSGGSFVTVTFSFRVAAAGTYTWRCFAPCGTGPGGFSGPMQTPGYMLGTLSANR